MPDLSRANWVIPTSIPSVDVPGPQMILGWSDTWSDVGIYPASDAAMTAHAHVNQ